MKLEIYKTVSFPVYAISYFENEIDFSNMFNWEKSIKLELSQSGYRFVDLGFGDSEYFSKNPCFGLPCMCVDAVVYAEKM